MDISAPQAEGPENDRYFVWAMHKLKSLYADEPGGSHARLVKFQADMFGLCEAGYLVPVRMPGHVHYHLKGRVPVGSLIISLAELREMHRAQLRVSAARWN